MHQADIVLFVVTLCSYFLKSAWSLHYLIPTAVLPRIFLRQDFVLKILSGILGTNFRFYKEILFKEQVFNKNVSDFNSPKKSILLDQEKSKTK